MNPIRIVLTLTFVWIAWFLIRNYLMKQRHDTQSTNAANQGAKGSSRGSANGKGGSNKKIPLKIVKCRLCEVHLPENAAVKFGNDWFCGQPHKQAWLEKH
jgi:hypothetical protein